MPEETPLRRQRKATSSKDNANERQKHLCVGREKGLMESPLTPMMETPLRRQRKEEAWQNNPPAGGNTSA